MMGLNASIQTATLADIFEKKAFLEVPSKTAYFKIKVDYTGTSKEAVTAKFQRILNESFIQGKTWTSFIPFNTGFNCQFPLNAFDTAKAERFCCALLLTQVKYEIPGIFLIAMIIHQGPKTLFNSSLSSAKNAMNRPKTAEAPPASRKLYEYPCKQFIY